MLICFNSTLRFASRAFTLAEFSEAITTLESRLMIATTTRSSINVNPFFAADFFMISKEKEMHRILQEYSRH